MIRIRLGAPGDSKLVGVLHARSRQHAYSGVIPPQTLAAIDPAEQGRHWAARLDQQAGTHRLLIAEADGRPVGFAYAGKGVLDAIHVEPESHGTGAGRALIHAARKALRELGFDEVELWVVEGNERARRFYEIDGWQLSGLVRDSEINGCLTHQLQYVRSLRGDVA